MKSNVASNKLLDVRAKQRRFILAKLRVFRPTSTPPLDASCLKTQSDGLFKIKQTRSAFLAKLRVGKRRSKDDDASNKLLDARRKQRLCYRVVRYLSAGLVAVSARVNAAVRRFIEKL